MQHVHTTPARNLRVVRLLGVKVLLLLYLLTATPLVPGLIAMLAALDPSHRVAIQQGACGLQVVLRHDGINSPAHRHGMVARTLAMLAQRTTTSHPDHVLQFSVTDSTSEGAAVAVEPETETPLPAAFVPRDGWLGAPRMACGIPTFPRPPPVASGLSLTLRSTVLVI